MANVTIIDVAKRAGVSASTVSRVINGNYPVSEEAAAKVHGAVKELDFTPHILASNLKSGKSRMIGIIASNIVNSQIMMMIKGMQTVLDNSPYLMTITSTENDVKKEARLLRSFFERKVDAVIVNTSSDTPDVFDLLRKHDIPVVLLDRSIPNSGIDTIIDNNFESSYAMTENIIRKGHAKIMVLKGKNINIGTDRHNGFLAAMREYGLPVEPHLQLHGNFTLGEARRQTLNFFSNQPRERWPSVIFAFNPLMAEGVMEALHEVGLNIPEDISLASYGTVIESKVFKPSIACVTQSSFYMGQQAARLALQRLDEQGKGQNEKSMQLVVESTIVDGDSLLDLTAGASGRGKHGRRQHEKDIREPEAV